MAGTVGNRNAAKGAEWFGALRRACKDRGSLAKIALKVVELAEEGERWAVEEIANRFDGKPQQSILLGEDSENRFGTREEVQAELDALRAKQGAK